jgi:hypothetical protein
MINISVLKNNPTKLLHAFFITFIAVIVYSFFFTTTVEASASEQPQSLVAIEDPILEQWIRGRLNKPNGEITVSDWLGITEIELEDAGLTSLVGLENATNITRVAVYDNRITDLAPLKSLPRLREKKRGNNLISDLSPISWITLV